MPFSFVRLLRFICRDNINGHNNSDKRPDETILIKYGFIASHLRALGVCHRWQQLRDHQTDKQTFIHSVNYNLYAPASRHADADLERIRSVMLSEIGVLGRCGPLADHQILFDRINGGVWTGGLVDFNPEVEDVEGFST